MPKGLKIMNRADITLRHSAQTIGVEHEDKDKDYEDDNNKEEEYKEEDLDSNDKDSLSKWSRQFNRDSDSKSSLDDSDDDSDGTIMNEQVHVLDGYVLTTGVKSYIKNKKNNKDSSEEDTSTKHEEINEANNTEDINRNFSGNKDQKSTSNYNDISKESTNDQAANNYTTLSRESRNNTSLSPCHSNILSRLKQRRSSRAKVILHRHDLSEYQMHLYAVIE